MCIYITGRYRKVNPKPKPNRECRTLFNLPKQNMQDNTPVIILHNGHFCNFYLFLNISCIILHMVKLFHIKIRKIQFCHNSNVMVSNPHPPNVIWMLSVTTWVWISILEKRGNFFQEGGSNFYKQNKLKS